MNDKPSRMDYRQHQAARRLVHECCNYDEGNCLLLDDGDCFVGDLERRAVLEGYAENLPLRRDWETVLASRPKRIFYAHGREEVVF
ncbi:MAG: cysteine-rich VLP protein [Clostridia bacterium]|nr:cysteine-rich VLP protein [Clostridia bacterium]